LNICVFASGSGTNFKAIISSAKNGYLNSKISLLITNNPHCTSVEIAKENGITVSIINRKLYPNQPDSLYSEKFLKALEEYGVDFIVLAGFMQKIPDEVISKFRNRIINIHPALLPSFGGKGMYGINVHKAVIASGAKVSGITIHFVDETYDEGKIIFQHCCEVRYDDDEFFLQEKIKALEHKYYSEIIKKFEDNEVEIVNEKVFIKNL